MITTILLPLLVMSSAPALKYADLDVNIKTCYKDKEDRWIPGAFDWKAEIFTKDNDQELRAGLAIGPIDVIEDLSSEVIEISSFDNYKNVVEKDNYLYEWYQRKLEVCTKRCYRSPRCYATWAVVKFDPSKNKYLNYFDELKESIEMDFGKDKLWFYCTHITDQYKKGLRDVSTACNGYLETTPKGNNSYYEGRHETGDERWLILSHVWFKPENLQGTSANCDPNLSQKSVHTTTTHKDTSRSARRQEG